MEHVLLLHSRILEKSQEHKTDQRTSAMYRSYFNVFKIGHRLSSRICFVNASALNILQGENKCFHGIGMVLPLLTRIKKQLRERFFTHFGQQDYAALHTIVANRRHNYNRCHVGNKEIKRK
jgi:hypothetical protein